MKAAAAEGAVWRLGWRLQPPYKPGQNLQNKSSEHIYIYWMG